MGVKIKWECPRCATKLWADSAIDISATLAVCPVCAEATIVGTATTTASWPPLRLVKDEPDDDDGPRAA